MDRRFSRSVRAKRREREFYYSGARRKADSPTQQFSTHAYYHSRELTKSPKVDLCLTSSDDSTIEEDLCSQELHGRLCKETDGTLMNKITDEVSKIVEKRHSSPSVIAKLMGLDELSPPAVVSEISNDTGSSLLKKSFAGLGGKYDCSPNQSFHVGRRQHQKFKIFPDNFDSSNAKKHTDEVVRNERRNSMSDIVFIKKQFIEARRLSTKETHKKSKEFRDALDIMDSKKDIFLKVFEEPNSLFVKHFHDLKYSNSSSHANRLKILESSTGKSEAFYRSVEETMAYKRNKKDTIQLCAKPCTSIYSDSSYNHADSFLPKLLRSQYTGKAETSPHSSATSIVILKPSNQKALSTGRSGSFPGYLQNYKLSCRKHTEFHRKYLVERGEQHHLFNFKTKGCNMKADNDIAGNISTQVNESFRSYSEEVLAKIDKYNSSSISFSEPSLSRVAMKSIPEQEKITMPSRQRLFGEGVGTLGEMLSRSEKEMPKTLDQLILKNKSDERVDKEHIHRSWAYPSGISSNAGWKDECDELLPSFEYHPDSSAIYVSSKPENRWQVGCINSIQDGYMLKDVLNLEGNDLHNSMIERGHSPLRKFKYNDNKTLLLRSRGEENKRPAKEVEVCQDQSKNAININNLVEPKPIYLQRKMDDFLRVCNSSNPLNFDSNKSFVTNLKEFQQSTKFNVLSVNVIENEAQEVPSVDFALVESTLDVIGESGAFISSEFAERLSPVSVLEPRSDDGKSTLQLLETIGADLHDIQRQLNFLELEIGDSSDEQSKSLIFNDKSSREILKSLKKGDERDFLYFLDMLTVSGIYATNQNKCFDAFYSPDNPVFPDVFEKLENEHNMINLWSKSERKLLFDHINSILAEVLAPSMDLHPWVRLKKSASIGHGESVDELWRLLLRQRKTLSRGKPEEKVLDTKWLYIDDHVDMIGREIERMLKDDLLSELVSDFVCGLTETYQWMLGIMA